MESNNFYGVKQIVKTRSDSLPISLSHTEGSRSNDYGIKSLDELKVRKSKSTIQESCSDKNLSLTKFGKRQTLVLITLAYGNFMIAACVSLQAPFFPAEAEAKGATSTQYGLIFGIYELVICLTCPIFGKLVNFFSPNFLCEIGLFISGASTVLFGFLDKAPYGTTFIALCFIIRIIEGIAAASFMTASYVVMAKEFPDRVATTFSILETAFGLGLILGPTLGGALYELGGFIMPFSLLGLFLFLGGAVIFVFMPSDGSDYSQKKSGISIFRFMSDFGIILDSLAIVTSLNFIGFNAATLEPHLRQFDLSPVIIGCVFVISGGIYAITSIFWGKLCELGANPKILCIIGSVLCSVGYCLIGPIYFINIQTKLWLIVMSLVFIGLGIAAKLVTAFVNALNDSIKRRGLPNDISTYGLVSAMFFSSCSVGAFVGPSMGGFLLERIGYKKSLIVLIIGDVLMVIMVSIYVIYRNVIDRSEEENEPLIRSDFISNSYSDFENLTESIK